jgi:hypothetical protein
MEWSASVQSYNISVIWYAKMWHNKITSWEVGCTEPYRVVAIAIEEMAQNPYNSV